MFTEEESREQDAAFAAIKEEFENLVKQEKSLRESLAGMGEPLGPNEPIDPAVQKMVEEAKEKAKREGAARAEEFQRNRFGARAKASSAGSRRQGVVRV